LKGSTLPIAWLNLRHAVPERFDAFKRGFERLGYMVRTDPTAGAALRGYNHPRDVFLSWNLIGYARELADKFRQYGHSVLVVENATWGNSFAGKRWYTLCRNVHNTRSPESLPVGHESRFDALGVDLAPWRTSGETVILPQRGIGPAGVAMPFNWTLKASHRFPGARIRPHPGTRPCKPLVDDLANAGRVITWGSGAAVLALTYGVPATSQMPNWIGEQDNTDVGRLAMFRRLAWSQVTLDEIASGEALERLL
jgi:hypothetical protein